MISHPIISSEVPILGRPGARLMYVNYFGLHYQIDDEITTMTFMPGVDWKIQNAQVVTLIEKYAAQLIRLGMAGESLGEYRQEEQIIA